MSKINFYQNLDLHKNQAENLVLHNVNSTDVVTKLANPVAGQLYYEPDTKKAYVFNGTKWVNLSASGLNFKGVVGGATTGALANLPTTNVEENDAYMVGADGDYGKTGSTQHANLGDFFFCSAVDDTTSEPTWSLVESGNGAISEEKTIVDGTTTYTLVNTLKSKVVLVSLYDENGVQVYAPITISDSAISFELSTASATELAGKKITIVAIAG